MSTPKPFKARQMPDFSKPFFPQRKSPLIVQKHRPLHSLPRFTEAFKARKMPDFSRPPFAPKSAVQLKPKTKRKDQKLQHSLKYPNVLVSPQNKDLLKQMTDEVKKEEHEETEIFSILDSPGEQEEQLELSGAKESPQALQDTGIMVHKNKANIS